MTRPSPNYHKCLLLEDEIPAITYNSGGTYTLGALMQAIDVFQVTFLFFRHKRSSLFFLVEICILQGQCYKTLYGRKLRMFMISLSVCPWQNFPS